MENFIQTANVFCEGKTHMVLKKAVNMCWKLLVQELSWTSFSWSDWHHEAGIHVQLNKNRHLMLTRGKELFQSGGEFVSSGSSVQ